MEDKILHFLTLLVVCLLRRMFIAWGLRPTLGCVVPSALGDSKFTFTFMSRRVETLR